MCRHELKQKVMYDSARSFPNGFYKWCMTHHIVVEHFSMRAGQGGQVDLLEETEGLHSLINLGNSITEEFEYKYEGVEWDKVEDYQTALNNFLISKNL